MYDNRWRYKRPVLLPTHRWRCKASRYYLACGACFALLQPLALRKSIACAFFTAHSTWAVLCRMHMTHPRLTLCCWWEAPFAFTLPPSRLGHMDLACVTPARHCKMVVCCFLRTLISCINRPYQLMGWFIASHKTARNTCFVAFDVTHKKTAL